jgi:membrane-associated protein
MSGIKDIIDLIIHFDKHLIYVVQNFGSWAYVLLFIVIFAETGFVLTPFLPGDSLLFIVGAFAAKDLFNIFTVFVILSLAAIIGDSVNYAIGKHFGHKIFKYENARILKKEYLEYTHKFYEKYGARTIVIARFVPIVRTFAPFVAGIGRMNYLKFISYNVIGAVAWVGIFTFGGFWFGNIPIIKNNFAVVTFVIIILSVLPVAIKLLKVKSKTAKPVPTIELSEVVEE